MHVGKSKEEMRALYLKDTQRIDFLRREDVIPRILDLNVCPKCERPAFKDKGYAARGIIRCVNCGYSGPADKFYNVEMHLLDGGID